MLSGETEDNLEEILVDLFEHEFLENHDKVRKELQDYRGDTLNDPSMVKHLVEEEIRTQSLEEGEVDFQSNAK